MVDPCLFSRAAQKYTPPSIKTSRCHRALPSPTSFGAAEILDKHFGLDQRQYAIVKCEGICSDGRMPEPQILTKDFQVIARTQPLDRITTWITQDMNSCNSLEAQAETIQIRGKHQVSDVFLRFNGMSVWLQGLPEYDTTTMRNLPENAFLQYRKGGPFNFSPIGLKIKLNRISSTTMCTT